MYKPNKIINSNIILTQIANYLKYSPIKLNESQASLVNAKIEKAVHNDINRENLSDHKYWEML
jgi:hypothetical protein